MLPVPSQARSCPHTCAAAGWELAPSPQAGSVIGGLGWNVHGDSIIFELKEFRFEPGIFIEFLWLGVKFKFYFWCWDEGLVSF